MKILPLAVFAALAVNATAADRDLLSPEKAFRLSAQLAKSNEIVVRYDVAPGYYLYRDKLKFSVEPAAVALGSVKLPPGRIKEDEFFGRVETYRGEVLIRIPVKVPPGADHFMLVARSQGCADAGICYTPQQQQVLLGSGLGERAAESPKSGGASLLDALGEDAAPKR